MKFLRRTLAATLAVLAFSAIAADGSPSPPPAPKIAIHIYPDGKFFTPEGIPELKGYYCLTGIGVSGNLEVHCAKAPFLI